MEYITICGINNFFGVESFKVGQILFLKKEIENAFDDEAIKVVNESDITYGYIANSVTSKAKGTHSSGYIYNTFKNMAKVEICFIIKGSVIAKIIELN